MKNNQTQNSKDSNMERKNQATAIGQSNPKKSVSKAQEETFSLNFPTVLTFLRIILVIPLMICLLSDGVGFKISALVIFVVAALTDKIDGDWARAHNEVTKLGKFLDPLADKMLVNLTFLALVYLNIVPLWIFAIILVRDLAMDGLRMQLASEGTVLAAGWLGKWKTTFQMLSLVAFLANLIFNQAWLGVLSMAILHVALILTIVSAVDYFYKALKK